MSNAAAVIGIVLFAFFLTGVTVGIIAVIAVSARAGAAQRLAARTRRAHPGVHGPISARPGPDDNEPANLRGSGWSWAVGAPGSSSALAMLAGVSVTL